MRYLAWRRWSRSSSATSPYTFTEMIVAFLEQELLGDVRRQLLLVHRGPLKPPPPPGRGSDYGPIPYGVKEHVQIVEDVLPSPAERQQVFWKTSNRVFRLGLFDTDLITI